MSIKRIVIGAALSVAMLTQVSFPNAVGQVATVPEDVNRDGRVNYADVIRVAQVAQATANAPTPTRTPRATATARPTATPTATAIPPTATPRPAAITAFNYGDTPEKFDVVFAQLKSLAASSPGLPACDESNPAIHPKERWHGLVYFEPASDLSQIKLVCRYSHEHGQDPNQVNGIFGVPGAWFGREGQSISSPAQTFYVPSTITDTKITTQQLQALGISVQMENDFKHEGYRWFVFSGSDCSQTELAAFLRKNCVVAARVQLHVHFSLDFHVRYHSYTLEFAVRGNVDDPNTQGIVRSMGWADHAALIAPPFPSRCFIEFNKEPQADIIPVPADRQFFPLPTDPNWAGSDTRPFDEFRCHQRVPLQYVIQNPSGANPAVVEQMPFEWWLRTGDDLRVQVMIANPPGGPTSAGASDVSYCQQAAAAAPRTTGTCRWTGSKAHFNSGYILPVIYDTYYINGREVDLRDDPDGDGILSAKNWLTRWGDKATGCTAVGLDCLIREWSGNAPIPMHNGQPIQGFKDLRPTDFGRITPFDGDITPMGIPSWIRPVVNRFTAHELH